MKNTGQNFIRKIIFISKTHKRLIDEKMSSTRLHRSMHVMLMNLSRCEITPSQKDLAKELRISPAAVAATLKKLETEGYIERSLPEKDRRAKEIKLTEKGREIVERSHEMFESIDSRMLAGISDEELDRVLCVFEKISENLTEMTKNK